MHSSPTRALGFALAILASVGVVRAQTQASAFAAVEIVNTTKAKGVAVADVVVPLARGAHKTVPALRTGGGRVCQVVPLGAPWPDGSLRYLKVDLPVAVTGGERRRVWLYSDASATQTFRLDPNLFKDWKGFDAWFQVGSQRLVFGDFVLEEAGQVVQVMRSRLRFQKSTIWAELRILFFHKVSHARFYLSWGNSNPKDTSLDINPGAVSFGVKGADLVLDEEQSKALGSRLAPTPRRGRSIILHKGGYIADGQAQCFEGRIEASGASPRVRAIAHGWADSGAFGPFGELLSFLPVPDSAWKTRLASEDFKHARHPWAAPVHGCDPNPAGGGTQTDFGVIQMRDDLVRTDPTRLRLVARSVFQEWCRPTHFKEADVSPVMVANHPKLVLRDGRPHYRVATWVDTLGKPGQDLNRWRIATDPKGQPFRGHDAEHISINYLSALALITGDRQVLSECRHHVQLWLGEFTVGSQTYNDGPGAARAVGRSLLAGTWLWLATGDRSLAARVEARTKAMATYLLAKRLTPMSALPGVLMPRYEASLGHYWPAWEEAIAGIGFAAVHEVFGTKEAAAMSLVIGSNVLWHGIGFTNLGWRVGYKLPFVDAASKPYACISDPNFQKLQAAGSGLTMWTLPILIRVAVKSGNANERAIATRVAYDLLLDQRVNGEAGFLRWIPVF